MRVHHNGTLFVPSPNHLYSLPYNSDFGADIGIDPILSSDIRRERERERGENRGAIQRWGSPNIHATSLSSALNPLTRLRRLDRHIRTSESKKFEMEGNENDNHSEALQMTRNPRARKLRSLVWNDFTKEQKPDGSYVAICNHCKKQLTASSRSGTTHLKNHLGTCLYSKKPMKRKKLLVRRLALKSLENFKVDAKSEEPASLDGSEFDQELSRYDLARMIVVHGYPFSMVQHIGFKTFVRNLQPQFKMVSCDTIKADCMKIYEDARIKLHEVLDKLPCRFSLSVDMWKSSDDVEFLCLTCHYVDNDYKLQRKILSFSHVEASLTGEETIKAIIEDVHDWNIFQKLSSIVLDNCSNGDVVAKELLKLLRSKGYLHLNGDLFHVNSCQNILNHIVQDCLMVAHDTINRVRHHVQCVTSSQERLKSFLKEAKQIGSPLKSLVTDVPTSWTSTYLMLQTACEFQEAFTRLAEHDSDYSNPLSAKDWTDIKALVECLEVFYHAIEKMSATRVPTANLYFNDMCGIHLLMRTWCMSPLPVVASMASKMLDKFEEDWGVTRMVMAIASILDPRYKMKSIEYFFKLIYDDSYEVKARIENIRKNLINLYNEYVVQSTKTTGNPAFLCYAGTSTSCTSSEYGSAGESKTASRITLSDTRRGLDQYLQETSSSQSVRSDLDLYMEEAVHPSKEGLDDNFNILAWWKFNAPKYPVLSVMACDMLAIPVSGGALDSEGRTMNQYLSSLDPPTIQGLICAQDWLRDDVEASNMDGDAGTCLIPANKDDVSH